MDANKMMLNDIVLAYGEICHVTEIWKEGDKSFFIAQAKATSFSSENSTILPIPLTEDRLLKLGARKINHIDGYSFYTFSKSAKNNRHIDIFSKRTSYMSHAVNHCEYVHELQLLFKATGKELLCQ